jgi:uncharacterized protein YndB with AHSA1/START domain
MTGFEGEARVTELIKAPAARVWEALTNPALVRQYLYGAEINSNWQQGSPITYKGEWKGKPYEDKGTILAIEPQQRLKVTHYSPLSGLPDVPENYHVVTYALAEKDGQTALTITQANNRSQEEVDESRNTWRTVLGNIKKLLEG